MKKFNVIAIGTASNKEVTYLPVKAHDAEQAKKLFYSVLPGLRGNDFIRLEAKEVLK